jgi:Ca-activated chloride channel family protein
MTEANVLIDRATGQPVPLAMQRLEVTGTLLPVGALLKIIHRFKCEEGDKPLEAIYVSMLPRDGSLRRFVIKGEDFEVESDLKERQKARETYEAGVEAGHLSSLAEVSPDGMISLMVGQVKPGEEITVALEVVAGVDIRDKGMRFRYPCTLAPSYHARARVSSTPDGGQIELPEDVFGDLILPEWKTDSKGLHEIYLDLKVDMAGDIAKVSSPSHKIDHSFNDPSTAKITLTEGADLPNRDIVLDVEYEMSEPTYMVDEGLLKGSDRPETLPKSAPRWLAVVPSTVFPAVEDAPRRVCFVLDRSGSMGGTVMEQAQRATLACLAALSPEDEFNIIRFDNQCESMASSPMKATQDNRVKAQQFVHDATARGGTEMLRALTHARSIMGEGGGDIFLITDGQVYQTGTVIEQMVASGMHVHVVGIGSASQDRFLAQLARRTDGLQKFVSPREDVAGAAMTIFASIKRPVASNLRAKVGKEESKLTQADKIVWQGKPALIADPATGKMPSGIELHSDGLDKPVFVEVAAIKSVPDGTLALLQASRRVQDVETVLDFTDDKAKTKVLEQELTHLSKTYRLASRVMSLVAVVKREGDVAGEMDQKVVPVGLPQDMMAEGIFNVYAKGPVDASALCFLGESASAGAAPAGAYYSSTMGGGGMKSFSGGPTRSRVMRTSARSRTRGIPISTRDASAEITNLVEESLTSGDSGDGNLYSPELTTDALSLPDQEPVRGAGFGDEVAPLQGGGFGVYAPPGVYTQITLSNGPDLLAEVTKLEDDGGMPGDTPEMRVLLTVLLGLTLLNDGQGMYGFHLERMADFLDDAAETEADAQMKAILTAVSETFRDGVAKPGSWSSLWGTTSPEDPEASREAFKQEWNAVSSL